LLAPSVTRRLLEAFVDRPTEVPDLEASLLDVLTERERDVVAVVVQRLSNAEIADRL